MIRDFITLAVIHIANPIIPESRKKLNGLEAWLNALKSPAHSIIQVIAHYSNPFEENMLSYAEAD